MNGTGSTYRGTAMYTISGYSCMNWNETTNNDTDSDAGFEKNFCRNPDNSSSPWCYFMDPETNTTQRDFCGVIPQCSTNALTMFTRSLGVYIKGYNRKYVTGFDITAEQCALSCLDETGFVCRSFEFREKWLHTDRKCILTNESLYSLDQSDDPTTGFAVDLFTRIDTVCDAYRTTTFPESCPLPLSENLNVTASSVYNESHYDPADAILHADSWWRPTTDSNTEWLQVTFGSRMFVTAVGVQGGGERAPFWVKRFNVSYSQDGRLWWYTQYDSEFGYRANGEASCVNTVILSPPIRAKIVRIIPTQWKGHITMRVAVFGCLDDDCDMSAGMVDGSLHDGRITASSYSVSGHAPHTARPDPYSARGSSGWNPFTSDPGQWIRVEFQRERVVHTIVTQGCGEAKGWVTSYSMEYSTNEEELGLTKYLDGDSSLKIFQANYDGYSLVRNRLERHLVMRAIVIYPTTWKGYICLRVDFVGCPHNTCNRRLGMESGVIADYQLSASTVYLTSVPQLARLHLPPDDLLSGCWRPSLELPEEWLQVDLLTFHTVTGVITQGIGLPSKDRWVITYLIKYESWESDGTWRHYTSLDGTNAILVGNVDSNTESQTIFQRPFVTTKVRVVPNSWYSTLPCMRVEILGCPLQEVGEICGEGAVQFNGSCIGSVNNKRSDACDVIFAEGARLLKITSQASQDFIAQNFQTLRIEHVSEYIIGLKPDTRNASANQLFRWWDGTPMTYQNFFSVDNVFDDGEEICVAIDVASRFRWRIVECGETQHYHATMCQKDINECSRLGVCPSTCENIPGGYYCACPQGYFYQDDECHEICSQFDLDNSDSTVMQGGQAFCLILPTGNESRLEAEAMCDTYFSNVAEINELSQLELSHKIWINGISDSDTDDCSVAKVNNDSALEIFEENCNESFPFVCTRAFTDVRCGEMLQNNITSKGTNDTFGYIRCLNYPPWYNSGSSFEIHIQGPSHLVVRFNFLKMNLRRGVGADECLDSLTIVDVISTLARRLVRGRYCGTRENLEVITRSNNVTVTQEMGELTAGMALELGFVAFYEMIDCSVRLCDLGCGGTTNPNGTSGNLTTPHFPATLPPFSICNWNIHVTPGKYVRLSFPEFLVVDRDDVTGHCLDTVYVLSGPAQYDPTAVSTAICGKAPPLILTDSSNISVVYWTGLESQSLGFRAEYTVTDLPGCSVGSYNASELIKCNFDAAVITSPGYPYHFAHKTRHTWQITTSPATYIQLVFHEFRVPSEQGCEFNYVAVYDGPAADGATAALLGRYCDGVIIPERMYSSRNNLALSFRTDSPRGSNSQESTGFYAVYQTLRFEATVTKNASNSDYLCPDGWDLYRGHCYRFYNQSDNLRWTDAEMQCVNDQSHLVSIRDIKEVNYIHGMLTSEWYTALLDTYIGLTDGLSEGHFRWTDRYPMSYADWYIPRTISSGKRPQPDGDVLEDCTMITLHSIRATANWHDVSCASKDARQFICKKPAEFIGTFTETVSSTHAPHETHDNMILSQEEMQSECGKTLKRCDNGECTQLPYSCPNQSGDQSAVQTRGPSRARVVQVEASDDEFVCSTTGERFSISFYCDNVIHCADRSDETACDYPLCGLEEYQCSNGQCVDKSKRCDLIEDCADSTDESLCAMCNRGFQCYDGTCLSEGAICDGMKHCPGTRWEDEPSDCSRECDSRYQLTCNNGACANLSTTCLYDFDEYGLQVGCRDVTHLRFCESFECPAWTLKCPSSYCIPLRMRCDGRFDCPNGEDELHCDEFHCPGAYRCHGASYCVSPDKVCDGVAQCPERDDEFYCDVTCPDGCRCHGYSVECDGIAWSASVASLLPNKARLIKLKSLQHGEGTRRRRDVIETAETILHFDLGDFPYLANLDIPHNGIREISSGIFKNSTNLLKLSLAFNQIHHLERHTFQGLRRLVFLNLTGNPLTLIDQGTFIDLNVLPSLELSDLPIDTLVEEMFQGLDSLEYLSLYSSSLVNIEPRAFVGLGNLNMLDIRHTSIQNVAENMFLGLERLQTLYSDRYVFCCLIGDIEECTPPPDQFSSCEDLMRNNILRTFIWILGISSLLGNALVLLYRLKRGGNNEKNKVQAFLILNLAVSDFLMGVYMLIIASADLRFRNVYIFHAAEWESSALCKLAGLISVLSSEVSVIMLVVISLDRLWCVMFPLKNKYFGIKSARLVAAVGWTVMLVVSILPVLGLSYFAGSFYGRTGVCLALPLTQDKLPGWEFSVSFFLFFNVICFILILICYTGIYLTARRTSRKIRSSMKSQEMKMAGRMFLILFTDFLCWMPVIIMGILSLAGVLVIPSVVYAWTAVFILPMNSALNPYLYTISAMQLRNRRVGVKRANTIVSGDAMRNTNGSPLRYRLLLSDITRGQQMICLEGNQLNQLATELRNTVKGLHNKGISVGEISQSKILLHQVESSSAMGVTWCAELLMPKAEALSVVNVGGASTDAFESDLRSLNQIVAIMRRKLGRQNSSSLT